MVDGVWSWYGEGGRLWRRGRIRIGFAKEKCFQFGVKELRRDGKRWGLDEFVGWVGYLSQYLREFVPRGGKRRQLWLCNDWQILVMRWQKGRAILWWKRNGLNEVVVPWTADGGTCMGLGGLKFVVCEWYYFVLYSFGYFEQVECLENRSDVVVFGAFSKSTAESILNSLEAVYLGDVYVREERIANV